MVISVLTTLDCANPAIFFNHELFQWIDILDCSFRVTWDMASETVSRYENVKSYGNLLGSLFYLSLIRASTVYIVNVCANNPVMLLQ